MLSNAGTAGLAPDEGTREMPPMLRGVVSDIGRAWKDRLAVYLADVDVQITGVANRDSGG